jgi:hypothetical protein
MSASVSPPTGGEFLNLLSVLEICAMSNRTYSLSINTSVIDKPDQAGRRRSSKNWQCIQVTREELRDSISRGYALAPQFKNGRRKAVDFECAGFLAADVDDGIRLEEARDNVFVCQHASLIHTTASHSPEKDRFRIIFLLDEAILDGQDWADAQLGLAIALGSDRSVSDAARMLFGNSSATFFRIGRSMPPHVVADLIERGRAARAQIREADGRLLPIDSARRVAGAELIKLATGKMVRMDEIGPNVSVHCPNHDDADPSAFTVPSSRSATIGIHCMACKATFWPNDARDQYDFDAFDRLFEKRRLDQQRPVPDATGLERFFPPEPAFEKYQQAFLRRLYYQPGIMLVKSPKGSGKTEALKHMLDDIRAGHFKQGIKRGDRPKSVLLIGHRQALIREAAAKLGLWCYLEPKEEAPFDNMRTLAVCLDSLPTFNEPYVVRCEFGKPIWEQPRPHDLVIIDESEQVLAHLQSETIAKRFGKERCFDALMYEISGAKAVIALDADLGLVTTHAMRTMRPQDWASRCSIIYNAPIIPVQKRTMRLFSSRKRLEHEVIEAVRRGQRCFIVSNSKKSVDTLHKMILRECGESVVLRVITSDNSRDERTVQFLTNIKTEILRVQVVIGSPSIGTGIDITFPGGECMVDRVFGFFYPFINTHTDIDQQLCRVRNPGSVDVWISHHVFNFTSNVEVVKDDLARAYTVKRAVTGRRPDGMVEYRRDDPLLMICAHVTALQRASKNGLLELFCKLRQANGWSIERVDETVPTSPYEEAKKELAAERAAMLLGAQTILDADFIELDEKKQNGASLSREERIVHEKNEFERKIGVPLDAELIEMNGDGRLVTRIEELAEIVKSWSICHEDFFAEILPKRSEPHQRLCKTEPHILLATLMRAAGLTTAQGFVTGKVISADELEHFVRLCRENQTTIEETFGGELRVDFQNKVIKQLNLFLRRIGLKLTGAGTQKIDGRKIRYYRLPDHLTARMLQLARCYLQVKAKSEADQDAA